MKNSTLIMKLPFRDKVQTLSHEICIQKAWLIHYLHSGQIFW